MDDITLAALSGLAAAFAGTVSRHAPAGRATFASLSFAFGLASLSFLLRLSDNRANDAQEMVILLAAVPFVLYGVSRYRLHAPWTDASPLDRQLTAFAAGTLGALALALLVLSLLPARQLASTADVLGRVDGIIWVGSCLSVVGLLVGVRKPAEDEVLDIPAFQLTFLLLAIVVAFDEKLISPTRPTALADLLTVVAAVAALWLLFSSLGMSFRAAAARRRRLEEENARLAAESQEREEYLRAITSCAPLAIVAADRSGCITAMNEAAEHMCGLQPDEGVGFPLVDCFAADARGRIRAILRDVLGGQSVRHQDAAIATATGAIVPVRISVSPLIGDAGEAIGVVAVAMDLREQRRLETQLVQSEKMAAIGELASGVAHEFNNALAVMTLAAQHALMRPSPDVVRRALQTIVRGCERSGATARNLLSFAAPAPPHTRPVNLAECVEQSLALVESKLREAGITVSREYADDCPGGLADPGQAQQVFLNLLLNARDAIHHGGSIRVAVRPGVCDWCRERDGVEAVVSDSGGGIDPRDLPRIFDPFFTTKGPRGSGEGEGSGLGLSVALGIIQAHGGRITAESELGGGATFTVCLPRAAAAPHREAEALDVPGQAPAEGHATRALVVDDEDGIREVLAEFLQAIGCQVRTAADAETAAEQFNAGGFDIVFCDLVMPGTTDGRIIEAASAALPDAAIVVITGKADAGLEQDMLRRGAHACLRKPFRLQQVADLVAERTQSTIRA